MTIQADDVVDELDVAVIGAAGRFPGAADLDQFWSNVSAGVESVSFPTREELLAAGVDRGSLDRPDYVRACSVLADADCFDAEFFGYSPRDARLMDPQGRLFLECAWEAFEAAGYNPRNTRATVGVYASQSMSTYLIGRVDALFDSTEFTLSSGNLPAILANGSDFLSTRVSYKLHLSGPSVNVQTACSSSLVAIHMARQAVLNGECDMALAGGVSVYFPQATGYRYQEGNILSRDGHCRPFDAAASGTVFGRGVGAVLLKPLARAMADGDRIRAVIKGSAINNDGWNRAGYTAPGLEGQARVIAEALANAGVEADSVGYLEAHGTGTAQGDPIEVAALTQAFRASTNRRGFCAIGSLKANIGHLDIASGVAGFIKAMLVVEHGKLPPTVHYQAPNPQIDFETSPFFVNRTLTDWARSAAPRRAGVSAFGMGGTNAHVVLEQAPRRKPVEPVVDRPVHLLALSAKSEAALDRLAHRYLDHLDRAGDVRLSDVCFTAGAGRAHFEHRAVAEVTSIDEARQALTALTSQARVPGLSSGVAPQSLKPGIAFLFTGQGAQYVGMARQLYQTQPTFRKAIDLCDSILASKLEPRLLSVLYGGPNTPLDETRFTQPALFAIGYALAALWRSWGIEPTAVLGHSIGELTAATVAGAFDLEQGLKLVAARGRLMQSLPAGGAMAAIMADERSVQSAIAAYASSVSIAAVNGPSDTVISGPREPIDAVAQRFEREGVEVHRLQVSHAFHSPLIEPVLDEFEGAAARLGERAPAIDFVSNMTGRFLESGQTLGARYWRRHAREAVRFSDGLDAMRARGYRVFLEIGPHPTLTGIGRRSTADESLTWLPSLRRGRDDWRQMLETLRELYALGADVDWEGFDRDYPRRRVAVPTYPFERVRHWIEPKRAAFEAERPIDVEPTSLAEGGGYEIRWQPRERSDQAGTKRGAGARHVVLVDERAGVGGEIVRQLREAGDTCLTVVAGERYERVGSQHFSVKPEAPDDFDRLLRDVDADGSQPIASVIHAWAAGSPSIEDGNALGAEQTRLCASTLHLTQSLVKRRQTSAPRLCLLTSGAQAVRSEEKPSLTQAPILGLARTIGAEHPELRCLCIDIGARQELSSAAVVLKELASHGSDYELAFRDGRRYVTGLSCSRASGAATPSFSEGAHLITGGLGGVGLKLADWMVACGARNLVLLGRRAPSGKTQARIEHLVSQGASVSVVQADVSREADVRRVLADIACTGLIVKSVMHAAGVLDGGLVIDQRWPRFSEVLKAKIDGAWNLHRLTADLPLDRFVMFSSIASVTGLVGHGDYAAANAFLDTLAHYRRAQSRPALTVNWGPWADTGMAATLGGKDERRHFISYIDPDVALRRLGQALADGGPQLIAVDVDWKKFESQRSLSFESQLFGSLAPAGDARSAAVEPARHESGSDLLRELADAPGRQRHTVLLRFLESRATMVLGIDPSQGIDPGRPLRDLGLDSLQALELRLAIATRLARPLPATLLFDHPTLKALADHLLGELGFANLESPVETPANDEELARARQIAELERLTQEEAEALLLAELTGSHPERSDVGR